MSVTSGIKSTVRTLLNKTLMITLLALVILGCSVWGWWHYTYSTPSNAFNRMLSTMLSTPSVVRHVVQESQITGQKLDQTTRLISSPSQGVIGETVLTQGGSVITTENIATPETDYVRYTGINTDQKNKDGQSFNFDSVLGVWGTSGSTVAGSTPGQLYNQNIFSAVPIANLNSNDRQKLLDQIAADNVYQVDYGATEVSQRGSRPTYTYPVTVNPVAYVKMLKTFATMLGLKQLEQLDPSQYQNAKPISFQFVVDTWSGQIIEIHYSEENRVETYDSYGVKDDLEEPENAIPISELQGRLQQLQ